MKVPFIIYADMDSLLKKINMCHSNPENLSTTEMSLHTSCGYSLFTRCTFDTTKNKLDHILKCQKKLASTLHTFLLRKFGMKENFNKVH